MAIFHSYVCLPEGKAPWWSWMAKEQVQSDHSDHLVTRKESDPTHDWHISSAWWLNKPLWKNKVIWENYSQYMEHMFQTNQSWYYLFPFEYVTICNKVTIFGALSQVQSMLCILCGKKKRAKPVPHLDLLLDVDWVKGFLTSRVPIE